MASRMLITETMPKVFAILGNADIIIKKIVLSYLDHVGHILNGGGSFHHKELPFHQVLHLLMGI